ncbi:hypothetical protein SCORR_v1c08270 [Spiroplasma corruscae]|uniref:J domain-containing protein n=1 Tax=Spiroplasma corruscae TaxID=216934 RepID=A0A222EPY2_9MOLU|nr:J domain-containing protein [Spiroplasma corruscae]ASP28599.1 hypothetical protein SCORR_v1c08270 [Spiroplasma corruscae]
MTVIYIVITILIILAILFIFINYKKQNLQKKLKVYKKTWKNNSERIIKLDRLKISEKIDFFPFKSKFSNTKRYIKNSYIISDLLKKQEAFYKYWTNCEYNLFSFLEVVCFDYKIKISDDEFINIYKNFCNKSYDIYISFFIMKLLPLLIDNYKKYDICDPLFKDIDVHTDKLFVDFCESLKILIEEVKKDFDYRKYKNVDTNYKSSFEENFKKQYYKQELKNEQEELSKAYKILGVKPTDDFSLIKKTYLKLAKVYHPDKNKSDNAKKKMAEINNAFDIISSFREKN